MSIDMAEQLVTRENLLSEAIKYCQAGYSVIPVGRDKKPKISWSEFTKRCATEEEIEKWWSLFPYANIGLVTGAISGFIVVDADGPEGVASVKQFFTPQMISCTTPSGGMHLYYTCPDTEINNATRFMPGVDLRANGGYVVAPPSVGSNGNSYSWIPGGSIFENDLPILGTDLTEAINKTRISPLTSTSAQLDGEMFTDGRRDVDLFTTANTLFKAGMPYGSVEQIVRRLAYTCSPPFSDHDAKIKVESALKRAIVRERNLKQEINDFIAGTLGSFSINDMYAFLNIANKTDKFKANRVLKEFIDNKYIERSSTSKNGQYRRVLIEEEPIDFVHAQANLVNLKWPLGIENYVQLMPKNIAVIAGVPNAGKTAFCLNMVYNNMSKFDIYYFSSEMGSVEFKTRLQKFPIDIDKWKFTAIERTSDFHDIVRPDAVNIIDFLEVHDEFFKVGLYIKQIYDKLRNGVAIIALQRNKGNDTGIGGYRSLEKPRLYLNMGSDLVEVVKAKNWKHETINPTGLRSKFTLNKGWEFTQGPEGWYRMQ